MLIQIRYQDKRSLRGNKNPPTQVAMRIEIIADCRLQSREAIFAALKEFGYALLDVQWEALESYCK